MALMIIIITRHLLIMTLTPPSASFRVSFPTGVRATPPSGETTAGVNVNPTQSL